MPTPSFLASALALTVATGGIGIEPPVEPIQLVSRVYGQSTPAADVSRPRISAGGGYVVFESRADDLTEAADLNERRDVFLYDIGCDRMDRISDAAGGAQANGDSHVASVSGDGRYVAFASYASNLVPGDSNGAEDVFLLDRATGGLRRISAAPAGNPRPRVEGSGGPQVSDDGRFVVFMSQTDTLVAGDDNRSDDVFVYEIASGRLELVNRAADGGFADQGGGHPRISADGRRVVFVSTSSDLLGTNGDRGHLYLRDRATGITEMIDRAADGTPSDGDRSDMMYALSGDGRYVAFTSRSSRLWPGAWSGRALFLRDTGLDTLRPITTAPGDAMNNGYALLPALNHNAHWLAFTAGNGDFPPGIYQRSLYLRKVEGDHFALTPEDSNDIRNISWFASLSADAARLAFESNSREVMPGVSNGHSAIYVMDFGGAGPLCTSWSGK